MLSKLLCDALIELTQDLKYEIEILDTENICVFTQLFNGPKTRSKIFKLRLLENLRGATDGFLKDKYAHILAWIFETDVILELLSCSGGVPTCRWNFVFNILCEILNSNPQIMKTDITDESNCLQLRLAVATSLTFSSPVMSVADKDVEIDPIKRFNTFSKLAENKDKTPLFSAFYKLSAWHLRYVVGSWAEDDELEWARTNVPSKFVDPLKIGEAAHEMMPYRLYNDEGVSVHEGASYYKNNKVTLQTMHEIGGVCGAVSRFGAAVSQSYGVPAMPIGQPGHCAFLWWKDGEWVLSNDNAGIQKSTVHDGIQLPWCTKEASYVLLMNEAQASFYNYTFSEVLRIAAGIANDLQNSLILLSHSISICPFNFPTWSDLAVMLGHCQINGIDFLPILSTGFQPDTTMELDDILSLHKPIVVSDCTERAKNLVDGTDSEWWTEHDTAWIELDLQDICQIQEVNIKWWGISVSKSFNILSSPGMDYEFVRSSTDQRNNPKGYNQWSQFSGWPEPTRLIKFELKDGQLDPWGKNKMFGIRQIVVKGHKIGQIQEITDNNVVSTSCKNLDEVNNLIKGEKCCLRMKKSNFSLKIEFSQLTFVQNIHLFGDNLPKHTEISVLGSIDGEAFSEIIRYIEPSNEVTIYNCQSSVNYIKICHVDDLDSVIQEEIVLSQLLIYGCKLNIRDVLSFKLKKELSNYPQIQEKIKEIYDEASSKILSHRIPVIVSDCNERGVNLVDGTNSEWWTEKEDACIEIDLESPCIVSGFKIKWWGTSVSSNITLSILEPEKSQYVIVKKSKDAIETPEDMNGWSCFGGWDTPTRKIKLQLKDGSLDPWGMNKYFGIRQIIVRGRKIE